MTALLNVTKYSDPNLTVIASVNYVIPYFRKDRYITYERLSKILWKRYSFGAMDLILPTVDFLFLFNLIRYYPQFDAFEWVGK